jgi:hypothetical protein
VARRLLEKLGMGFLRYLLRRLAGRAGQPRFVRRVEMRCPHTDERVQIDLLMRRTGGPAMVLRCNRRPEAPPTCDQLCRDCAEAVVGPPHSLLLLPPGDGPAEEMD